MKKLTLMFCFASFGTILQAQTIREKSSKMIYPETKKVDTIDTYFGTQVPDPYRWLEDDRSAETEAWVKAENKTTFGYLDKIPFKEEIKKKLEKIWNYEKIGAPFKEGNYTYFYKNDGLQNQYVIYRYKTDADPSTAEVFLDPNNFSEDGTVSLGGLSFSEDGSLAAYSISEGGSDWRKVLVMNAETKEITEDTLVDIKFSGISWKENDGFYYSSYDKPEGSELSAKTDQHKVYYHKLNTTQKSDELIFGGTAAQKHRYIGAATTEDNKYLIVSASNATSGNKLFIKDLSKPGSSFITILDNEN
ncbi:MAG: S9 family peptidase, partial [Leeuwenhoekiella sp.]|nr:S9 family peptidase [Leeuwenhoekiella sp.]